MAIREALYPLTKWVSGLWRSPEHTAEVKAAMDQDFRQLVTYLEKANEPLAAYLRQRGGSDQAGRDWAKVAYGDYYATTTHVYRAVKLRADAVADARLKVWTQNRKGELEWVGEDHVVQQLLDRVNPFWSRVDMWRAVETYLSLWGSCFRWINRPTSDPATWEIWVLRPDRVALVIDKQPGPLNQYIKGYIYDPSGANFPMLPDEVIWDRYFNPLDEFAGLSPIAPTRLVIDMQASMLSTNRDLFRNGMLTSNLAFLMKGPLSPEQVDTFYERLADRHAGKGNAQKPIVSDLGQGDVKNMGFNNKEMEFLEGLQLTKEFILATYGIPEELIPGSRHSTFSNRVEARKEFNETTIEQEWILLESGMQEKFIPTLPGRFQGLILKFDRDDILALQENMDARSERNLKQLTAGARTLNEYRESVGLDPLAQGDVLFVPNTITPVTLSGTELVEPAPAENPDEEPNDNQAWMLPPAKRGYDPTEITDVDRRTWDAFLKRFDQSAKDFHELMDRLFEEQREDSLANLRRLVGTLVSAKGQGNAVSKAGPETVFSPEAWRQLFIDAGLPFIASSLEASATAQVVEFDLGISFEISNAVTQSWIDERVKFWTNHVNAETAKLITEEIRAGISEGEGIAKLQGRVNKVFNFNTEFRSELIARTEAVAASNQGNLEAYRQADIPRKRWLATLDDRTRDSHSAAHGQIVDRDQSFLVGGSEMMMPGNGPIHEVANCRCTTTPVFEASQRALKALELASVILSEPYDDREVKEAIQELQATRATKITKELIKDKDGEVTGSVEWHENV